MARRIGRAVLGFLLMGMATAAVAGERDPRAVAEDHAAETRRLVEQHRFREAAAAFERAQHAFPSPRYVYNTVRAYHFAGEVDEALGRYQEFLDNEPERADRREVERWMEELQADSGILRIASEPPGAAIAIDGLPQRTPAPLAKRLLAGNYEIVAELPGHVAVRRQVKVRRGVGDAVTLALAPLANATLAVDADVTGAAVFLDGRAVGDTPLRLPDVAPGPHVLRVEAADRQPHEQLVSLASGDTLAVAVALEPLSADKPATDRTPQDYFGIVEVGSLNLAGVWPRKNPQVATLFVALLRFDPPGNERHAGEPGDGETSSS